MFYQQVSWPTSIWYINLENARVYTVKFSLRESVQVFHWASHPIARRAQRTCWWASMKMHWSLSKFEEDIDIIWWKNSKWFQSDLLDDPEIQFILGKETVQLIRVF